MNAPNLRALPRRYPIPTLMTSLFIIALLVTAAFYADILPGIRRTLPNFVRFMMVTGLLLAVAVLSWIVSLVGSYIFAEK